MKNLKSFQGIIVGGKVSKTKAIIIALLKAKSNIPNIETPDEYKYTLTDVFDTSMEDKKNQRIKNNQKKKDINDAQTNFKIY